ncbi:MAG: tetratricopeptide repeat protein [Thermoanaerobaculia bacterium]
MAVGGIDAVSDTLSGTDQILRNPRKKQISLASILLSPTTLKVCNLAAALAAIWLFRFVLVSVPEMRQRDELKRAEALRADATRIGVLFEASRKKVEEKDWIAAATLSRQLVARDPENHVYLKQLATTLRPLGRYSEEAESWERFMKVAPNPAQACPTIAEAWQKAGRPDRALLAYERCYQLAPQDVDTIFYLARSYERARRARDARALYQKGMELSPGYLDMAVGLGRTYLSEEKPDVAESLARGVLDEKPDYTDALLLLGSALLQQKRLPESRAALERGIAISPRYSDIHYMLGRVSEDEGKRDDALRWYREALAISPERGDARARIAALGGGA